MMRKLDSMDRVLEDLILEQGEGINPILLQTRLEEAKETAPVKDALDNGDTSALDSAMKIALEATEAVRLGSPIE